MKAAFLLKPGKIELREVPDPSPNDNEVVIKIEAANTCGTDYKMFRQGYPLLKFPISFGHEFSGIIAKAGSQVTKFKEGDSIMTVQTAPCLECRYCKRELPNLCLTLIKEMRFGAFAEYIIIPERIIDVNMYHKPEALDFATAALLEPLSCVINGIDNLKLDKVERILIFGAGPIGLFFADILSKKYNKKVMIIEPNEYRRNIAESFSVDKTVNPTNLTNDDLSDVVRNWGNGFYPEIVIDATGLPEIVSKIQYLVDRGGQILFFGGPPKNTSINLSINWLHYDQVTVLGVFHLTPKSVQQAREILIDNDPDFTKMLTETRKLNEIIDVFENPPKNSIKTTIIPE